MSMVFVLEYVAVAARPQNIWGSLDAISHFYRIPDYREPGSLERLEGYEPFPDGVLGEFSNVTQSQFTHDVASMRLDRADRDMYMLCDRGGAQSLGDQAQHFPLPAGERGLSGASAWSRATETSVPAISGEK